MTDTAQLTPNRKCYPLVKAERIKHDERNVHGIVYAHMFRKDKNVCGIVHAHVCRKEDIFWQRWLNHYNMGVGREEG